MRAIFTTTSLLAQLVERETVNLEANGSTPLRRASFAFYCVFCHCCLDPGRRHFAHYFFVCLQHGSERQVQSASMQSSKSQSHKFNMGVNLSLVLCPSGGN